MSLEFEDLFEELPNMVTLECLKYAHENGCPGDEETCACSCLTVTSRVFDIFTRKRMSLRGSTCLGAAINDHLECLKYAREKGVLGIIFTCYLTAKNGQLRFEICARTRVSLG